MVEPKDSGSGSGKTGVSGKAGASGKPSDKPPSDKAGISGKPSDKPPSDKTGVSGKVDDKPPSDKTGVSGKVDDKPPSSMDRSANPPTSMAIARDKWERTPPAERTAIWSGHDKRQEATRPKPNATKPNLHVPPPGSDIPMAAWRAMPDDERAAAWEAARQQAKVPKPGPAWGRNTQVPPPGSDIPMAVWRAMAEDERAAEWAAYKKRTGGAGHGGGSGGGPDPDQYRGNQINLNVPPPGSGYSMQKWRAMELDVRAYLWAEYHDRLLRLGVRQGERVVNEALLEFLSTQRDPETGEPYFVTIQDLINHDPTCGFFEAKCKEFGLDPVVLYGYRYFPLRNFAVLPPPARSGVPSTTKDANKYFITQYDTIYNTGSPNKTSSNNCGPTSLAMVMQTLGVMPPAILASSPEDQIDYVRALMEPNDPRIKDRKIPHPLPNGSIIRVLDADGETSGFGDAYNGAQYAARTSGMSDAKRETGWDNFADAVITNHQPVVLAGIITPTWISLLESRGKSTDYGGVSGSAVSHFIAVLGTTADGSFIVADPMFAGGTVVLSLDELRTFVSLEPGDSNPEFLNPNFQAAP